MTLPMTNRLNLWNEAPAVVRFALLWLPMLLIAIGNGMMREAWYGRSLSELRAHQLSSLLAILLLGVYMWVVLRLQPPASASQALAIGLLWLALTVTFEFLFGRYIVGQSWTKLLADYNIWAGRLWPFVLLWLTLAPRLFYRS